MHSKLAVIILAALMVLPAAVIMASSDGSDAADPTYTVKGYISINGSALASKTVVISTSTAILGQDTTDSSGAYSIEITTSDITSLFIRVVYEGTAGDTDEVNYIITNAPDGIEPQAVTGDDRTIWAMDLSGFYSEGNTYTVSSSLSHGIVVTGGKATVGFHIIGKDSKDLYAAKISLYDGTKIVASGTTDYYGICEFSSTISYDTYRLVIKCNGYEDYESTLVVNEAQIYPEISLTEKTAPTFLGMTTYHLLMMFGVILGLALVVISYVLVARNWKGIEED